MNLTRGKKVSLILGPILACGALFFAAPHSAHAYSTSTDQHFDDKVGLENWTGSLVCSSASSTADQSYASGKSLGLEHTSGCLMRIATSTNLVGKFYIRPNSIASGTRIFVDFVDTNGNYTTNRIARINIRDFYPAHNAGTDYAIDWGELGLYTDVYDPSTTQSYWLGHAIGAVNDQEWVEIPFSLSLSGTDFISVNGIAAHVFNTSNDWDRVNGIVFYQDNLGVGSIQYVDEMLGVEFDVEDFSTSTITNYTGQPLTNYGYNTNNPPYSYVKPQNFSIANTSCLIGSDCEWQFAFPDSYSGYTAYAVRQDGSVKTILDAEDSVVLQRNIANTAHFDLTDAGSEQVYVYTVYVYNGENQILKIEELTVAWEVGLSWFSDDCGCWTATTSYLDIKCGIQEAGCALFMPSAMSQYKLYKATKEMEEQFPASLYYRFREMFATSSLANFATETPPIYLASILPGTPPDVKIWSTSTASDVEDYWGDLYHKYYETASLIIWALVGWYILRDLTVDNDQAKPDKDK